MNWGIVFVLAIVVWMIYMMTCRTDDWLRLMKADEERKQKQAERIGKATNGAFGIARWFMKR
jgi:hypothetical protein